MGMLYHGVNSRIVYIREQKWCALYWEYVIRAFRHVTFLKSSVLFLEKIEHVFRKLRKKVTKMLLHFDVVTFFKKTDLGALF
jgi:hypothetical protein